MVGVELQREAAFPKLGVVSAEKDGNAAVERAKNLALMWKSGLSGSLLFSLSDPPADAKVEQETQGIVSRYLERQRCSPSPVAMTDMVDFQRMLQLRSQVISAVETLMRDK